MAGPIDSEQIELLRAIANLDPDEVRSLLAQGAVDVNAPVDDAGNTALLKAVELEAGSTEILEALLDAGADPNMANGFGTTPLHVAAQIGVSVKLTPLLRFGADMNVQDMGGETPLHKCAGYNRPPFAESLMQMGADSTIKDNEGLSPGEQKRMALQDSFRQALCENQVPPLLGADWSKSAALNKETNGLCALDAGVTWLRAEKLLEQMQADGDFLNREDVLQQGKDGKTYLERAVENGAGEAVLTHLAQHGQALRAEDMLHENGSANALLEKLVQKKTVGALFSEEAWANQPFNDLSRVYNALPEEGREQVGNYHVLRALLRDQAEKSQQQGAGR